MSDQFHEPWAYDDGGYYGITDCNDSFVTNDISIDDDYGERIVACVNAMQGIPDPKAFMEAATRAVAENRTYRIEDGASGILTAVCDMTLAANPPETPDSSKEET